MSRITFPIPQHRNNPKAAFMEALLVQEARRRAGMVSDGQPTPTQQQTSALPPAEPQLTSALPLAEPQLTGLPVPTDAPSRVRGVSGLGPNAASPEGFDQTAGAAQALAAFQQSAAESGPDRDRAVIVARKEADRAQLALEQAEAQSGLVARNGVAEHPGKQRARGVDIGNIPNVQGMTAEQVRSLINNGFREDTLPGERAAAARDAAARQPNQIGPEQQRQREALLAANQQANEDRLANPTPEDPAVVKNRNILIAAARRTRLDKQKEGRAASARNKRLRDLTPEARALVDAQEGFQGSGLPRTFGANGAGAFDAQQEAIAAAKEALGDVPGAQRVRDRIATRRKEKREDAKTTREQDATELVSRQVTAQTALNNMSDEAKVRFNDPANSHIRERFYARYGLGEDGQSPIENEAATSGEADGRQLIPQDIASFVSGLTAPGAPKGTRAQFRHTMKSLGRKNGMTPDQITAMTDELESEVFGEDKPLSLPSWLSPFPRKMPRGAMGGIGP